MIGRGIIPLALAAALLAGCAGSARLNEPGGHMPLALTNTSAKGDRELIAVAIPQAQYDHPYRGRVIEQVLPLAEARRRCGGHDACNWTAHGVCFLILPKPAEAPVKNLAAYRRWETAGCNGHPDKRIRLRP